MCFVLMLSPSFLDPVLGMFLDFFLLFQMGMMYTYDGDGQSEE
jgi:hypothetical protein